MAKINSTTLRDWNNGETMYEADYEQEREILRTAINDNYDRLIKKYEVLDAAGTLRTTQNLDTAINYLKFKETAQIFLSLDSTSSTLTIGVFDGSITTAKLADLGVTNAKIADGSITTLKVADLAITNGKIADGNISTIKIADGAVNLQKIDTVSLDSRYYTETEVDTKVNSKADKKQEAWITPTILNDWVADPYYGREVVKYMKDEMGFVHMKGALNGEGSKTFNYDAFVLPLGYRPANMRDIVCHSYNSVGGRKPGFLYVENDGSVRPIDGQTQIFSFDNVIFKAE